MFFEKRTEKRENIRFNPVIIGLGFARLLWFYICDLLTFPSGVDIMHRLGSLK